MRTFMAAQNQREEKEIRSMISRFKNNGLYPDGIGRLPEDLEVDSSNNP